MDIKNELSEYPDLTYNDGVLEGGLSVGERDVYDIKVDISTYPKFFPRVYETGGRIPNKVERHIYTDTGSCCFTTNAKAQILLKTQITSLSLFIKEIVVPYFQNNSYYELNNSYASDEYSHNYIGVIEGYRDILMTDNDLLIAKAIYDRVNGNKLTIRDNCYCGSGSSLKKCSKGKHLRCYKDFKKIDKNLLAQDFITHFEKHLKK